MAVVAEIMGHADVSEEWSLVSTAHNILKLYRATT